MGSWSQGEYDLVNPLKYMGNKKPFYRSSWEKRFFTYCDLRDDVIRWGSEILVIPYFSPVDNKMHRYYTDVYMEVKTKTGNLVKYVIEIKPDSQTKRPKPPKRKTTKAVRNYKQSVIMFEKNLAKWKSTAKYCKSRGLQFKIITENELF